MNINATLLGQFIVLLAIFMAIACYYFGKRKTKSPKLTALAGAVSALVPIIAVVFLIVLILKDDIDTNAN